jgi:hypothetical protein
VGHALGAVSFDKGRGPDVIDLKVIERFASVFARVAASLARA